MQNPALNGGVFVLAGHSSLTFRSGLYRVPKIVTLGQFPSGGESDRTISSPARVIPLVTSFSPDWYFLGVRPNSTPAAFDFVMRLGSSIADL
jgi:hypothetical protein